MESKSRSILLVEDHADSANAMSHILTRFGHKTTIANSCESAIRIFIANIFDLLLLDIGLPDGDGCDLLKELNAIRKVPAIAITGVALDDIERSEEAGFVRHIQKPVQLKDLQQALDALG